MRLKNFAINLTLGLTSVALAFFLSEFAVRLIAPQQLILIRPDIWQPIDILGWVHSPSLNTTINTGDRTVRVLTDQDGFRVGRTGRVEADRRILLLGDSFMEAFQVEYEESIAGLLEQRLRDRLREPVAVRNTAVSDWDPNHYLLQAKRALEKERYDLAVLMLYLGNDMIKTRRDYYPRRVPYEVHAFRIPRALTRRELVDAIFYPINDFLEVRSHLFIFLKRKARIILMQLGLTAASFNSYFFKREATSVGWDVTAQICKDIVTLAKEHGIGTVIVLVPSSYQVDHRKFNEFVRGFNLDPDAIDLDQPNRLMGSGLQAHNLEFIDVKPDLQRASSRGLTLYGDMDDHFTANGHAVVLQAIEPVVVSRLRERIAQRP